MEQQSALTCVANLYKGELQYSKYILYLYFVNQRISMQFLNVNRNLTPNVIILSRTTGRLSFQFMATKNFSLRLHSFSAHMVQHSRKSDKSLKILKVAYLTGGHNQNFQEGQKDILCCMFNGFKSICGPKMRLGQLKTFTEQQVLLNCLTSVTPGKTLNLLRFVLAWQVWIHCTW